MANEPTKKPSENTEQQPMSLQERLLDKSVKAMEKTVSDQTTMKLQSGMNPQEILIQLVGSIGGGQVQQANVLQQVSDLSKQQVPTGDRMGIINSLLSGHGTSRPNKPEDLGFDNAIKILGLQNDFQSQQLDIPQKQVNLLQSLLELSGKMQPQEGETIERDVSGNPTTKGIQQQKTAEVSASKQAEDIERKKQLKQDLQVYFDIADLIPTGEGFIGRKIKGVENFIKGMSQDTIEGVATAQLDALNKRLRVSMVRAAGDVGNLNIVEQKAAELLLFKLDDATPLRAVKKAVLKDLTRAIKDNDKSAVKTIITNFMASGEFKKVAPELQKNLEGTVIKNNKTGQTMTFTKGKWVPNGE